jgi:hypothetical protein
MKKLTPFLLALTLFLTGCLSTLVPKPVELGQKKVQAFPEPKQKEEEVQKQTASLAATRAQDTLVAAVSNNAPAAVVEPAHDAAILTRAVSTVMGPPATPYVGPVTNLVAASDATVAKQNVRVENFAKRNDSMEGKKIEDTGVVKVPYIMWLGGALAGVFLLYILFRAGIAAVKAYGVVNPAVGVGTGIAGAVGSSALSFAGTLLHRTAEQVVAGGEAFKEKVTTEFEPAVAQKVLTLFQNEQVKAQDNDVKATIANLTK